MRRATTALSRDMGGLCSLGPPSSSLSISRTGIAPGRCERRLRPSAHGDAPLSPLSPKGSGRRCQPAAYQTIRASLLGTAEATPRPGPDGLIRIWLDRKFVERVGQGGLGSHEECLQARKFRRCFPRGLSGPWHGPAFLRVFLEDFSRIERIVGGGIASAKHDNGHAKMVERQHIDRREPEGTVAIL
jgi:hypothetical protein